MKSPSLMKALTVATAPPLLVRGRTDNRDGRELPTQERARLRHDQVGLKILAAGRDIEVREHELRIVGVSQGRERVRDGIARLVVPGLEMGCLGRANASQTYLKFPA